jgi:hypothetical protein
MKVTVTWQRSFTGEMEIDPAHLRKVFGSDDLAALGDHLAKHPIELVMAEAHGDMTGVEESPMTVQVQQSK